MRRSASVLAAPVLSLFAACTGAVGDANQENAPDRAGPAAMPSATAPLAPPATPPVALPPPSRDLEPSVAPIQCTDPTAPRGVARRGVRRLTRNELAATFAALVKNTKPFNTQFQFFPDLPEMADVAEFDALYSYDQAMSWALTVDAVAQSPTLPADLGVACLGVLPITEACWRTFFTGFGRRAWRRPLNDGEVSRLMAAVVGLPPERARYTGLSLLLQAPDFLFHLEPGLSAQGPRVRLTDHEVANRIAYALTGTMPDTMLAAAADRGELKTLAQVEAQVRRLLDAPVAKTKLRRFFEEWLELSEHPGGPTGQTIVRAQLNEGGARYPQFQDPGEQFRTEFWEYLEHVIWKEKGSFRDLMSRRIAFPRTEHMRKVLKVAAISDGTPVDAPDYPGLAFRGRLLVQGVDVTSPIARGVFYLRRMLCDELPSPDFTIVNARFDDLGELSPVALANHEIAAKLTSASQCATCHVKINPIGFVMEAYDTLGMRREQEIVYSNKYPGTTVLKMHPLPFPVKGTSIDNPTQTVTYNKPSDFADAMSASPRVAACALGYLFRHYERRREAQPDACTIDQWRKAAAEGKPVLELFVQSVANEDIFWRGSL